MVLIGRVQHATLLGIESNVALDLGVYPSYTPSGGINENTITDYSGFCYDQFDGCMLMVRGGHSATFANYAARLDTRAGSDLIWVRDHERTNRSVMAQENLHASGYWIDGGLSRDGLTNAPDALPLTNHTYTLLHFHKATQQLILLRPGTTNGAVGDNLSGIDFSAMITDKRIWHYSPQSRMWAMSSVNVPTWMESPPDYVAVSDPISGYILIFNTYAAFSGGIYSYDPVEQDGVIQRLSRNDLAAIGTSNTCVYHPPSDKFYIFSTCGDSGPVRVFEVTLNRSTWSNSTIVEVTGMTGTPSNLGSSGNITKWAYDVNNGIIGGGITAGHFYAYNSATKVWTDRTMTPSGTWNSGAIGSTAFFAMDYDSVNGVFVFITDSGSGRHVGAYRY